MKGLELMWLGSPGHRLGYRAASRDIDSKALAVLRHWTHEMGLHESKEHAELVNLYASGTRAFPGLLTGG